MDLLYSAPSPLDFVIHSPQSYGFCLIAGGKSNEPMAANIDRVIRSQRRTLALIVERDGSITVCAPMKMPEKDILDFVDKHAKWVQKKQKEVQSLNSEQPRQYKPGESFLFLGESYPLEIVRDADQKLTLDGSFRLTESAHAQAEAVFRSWYREQARALLSARVAFFADQFQVQVGTIRITSARTRWGSCTSKGNLSFSWRLILTPSDVIDYVVIHELAHTVHHNHSKRFWKLVEKWMPDYKERKKQLRQYGQLA